ncbi:hypothetical protein EDB19DRAFT_1737598 [Suillus lakei]|nr:hypothetical protein EDB19DRAFT_1737598 [Suillus lakei]
MESGDEVGDGVEDDLVDTFCQQLNTRTFQERMLTHVKNIRDFCDGLEYQIQFNDYRMLTVLERNGSSFLRLADNCLSRERRENSDHIHNHSNNHLIPLASTVHISLYSLPLSHTIYSIHITLIAFKNQLRET